MVEYPKVQELNLLAAQLIICKDQILKASRELNVSETFDVLREVRFEQEVEEIKENVKTACNKIQAWLWRQGIDRRVSLADRRVMTDRRHSDRRKFAPDRRRTDG